MNSFTNNYFDKHDKDPGYIYLLTANFICGAMIMVMEHAYV